MACTRIRRAHSASSRDGPIPAGQPDSPITRFLFVLLTAGTSLLAPLPALPAQAEPAAVANTPHRWVSRTWRTPDGLPQNTVNALLQTRDGFLWVGTSGGLARFDGVRFRTFGIEEGLASAHIFALHEDRKGILWVGTAGGGLARLDHDRFRVSPTTDGLPDTATVLALADGPDGTLWVGTERGLWRSRGGRFEPVPETEGLPTKQVRALCVDSRGTLWISVLLEGLFHLTPNGFARVPREAGLPDTLYRLFEDPQGRLWAGSSNGRLWQRQDDAWTRFDAGAGLPVNNLAALAAGGNVELWVGARDAGLRTLQQGRFLEVPGTQNLVGTSIAALLVDSVGTLWVGTVGDGLTRLSRELVRTWGTAEGLGNSHVTTVVEANGMWWVGTQNRGIWRLENGTFTRLQDPAVSLNYPYIYAATRTDDGSLWFAGEQALFRIEPGRPTTAFLKPPIRGEAIRSLCADGNRLWLGTFDGNLLRVDGGHVTAVATNGTFGAPISCMLRAGPDRLWVGTLAGLHLWDSGRIRSWTRQHGLPTAAIRALHQSPDGALWIGTAGAGLVRMKHDRLLIIGTRQGLVDPFVSQILADTAGHLWLGGNRGIFRLNADSLERFIANSAQTVHPVTLGRDEGMQSEQCSGGHSPTALNLPDGRLLFPTLGGLVELDPHRLRDLTPPAPQPIIDELWLDGIPVPATTTLVVPPGPHRIDVRVTAPALRGGDWLRFRSRLDGLEQHWTPIGNRRSLAYVGLPPGSYTLAIEAAGSQGHWNPRPAMLAIHVKPLFWQTPGFVALVSTVVGGTLFAGYRRRIANIEARRAAQETFTRQLIQAQEAERARLARELHDDITQRMARLAIDAGTAERPDSTPDQVGKTLRGVRADLVKLSEDIHSLSYRLHPSLLDDLGFIEALRVECERVSRQEGIRCELLAEPLAAPPPRDTALGLFRIAQEALRNAIRHGNPRNIEVRLRPFDAGLQLAVRDDGCGFDPNRPRERPSIGLMGMRERVILLNGELEIDSAPGRGTTLLAWVPMPSPNSTSKKR